MICKIRSVLTALVITLILVGLGGCANLAPVRTFADETKKLSAAFDPMLTGSTETCVDKYKWKKLITSSNFDPVVAENNAKALCGSIDEDNKVIADLNSLLEQYADTISALADEKLPTYKTELDGLKGSLGNLKKHNSQSPLLNVDKLNAINSLTDLLSKLATQKFQQKEIRKLLDHELAINAITDALNDYATLNYKGWLSDQQREILLLRKDLDNYAQNQTLASNYLKTLLLTEERQVEAKSKSVDAFTKSVAALQKANSELRAKFDRADDKELIKKLQSYAEEVSNLSKQINKAF